MHAERFLMLHALHLKRTSDDVACHKYAVDVDIIYLLLFLFGRNVDIIKVTILVIQELYLGFVESGPIST